MPVEVSLGFDGGTRREFFHAKQQSDGSISFDVLHSRTTLLETAAPRPAAGDETQHVRAVLESPAGSRYRSAHEMSRDLASGTWRLLVDLEPGRTPRRVSYVASDGRVIPGEVRVDRGDVHPAYAARVAGSAHQASEGVGGRSACTAIAAIAALRALRGEARYWQPAAVDSLLREGTRLYERHMAGAGGAGPAGVEHTEFDALVAAAPDLRPLRLVPGDPVGILTPDGRAFEGLARELWEAGRRRPAGVAVTCAAQTLVAVALPGPPRPELVSAVADAYRSHPRGWRPPPLAALPCTLLLFDSHRHTAERGGPRDAAWLLFPSPEALAAYLGLERFPCFNPTDPGVSEYELLLTRQFARFSFHAEGGPAPPPQAEDAMAQAGRGEGPQRAPLGGQPSPYLAHEQVSTLERSIAKAVLSARREAAGPQPEPPPAPAPPLPAPPSPPAPPSGSVARDRPGAGAAPAAHPTEEELELSAVCTTCLHSERVAAPILQLALDSGGADAYKDEEGLPWRIVLRNVDRTPDAARKEWVTIHCRHCGTPVAHACSRERRVEREPDRLALPGQHAQPQAGPSSSGSPPARTRAADANAPKPRLFCSKCRHPLLEFAGVAPDPPGLAWQGFHWRLLVPAEGPPTGARILGCPGCQRPCMKVDFDGRRVDPRELDGFTLEKQAPLRSFE